MAAGDESSGEGADDRSKPLERTATMMRFQIQRCNRPMPSTHEPAALPTDRQLIDGETPAANRPPSVPSVQHQSAPSPSSDFSIGLATIAQPIDAHGQSPIQPATSSPSTASDSELPTTSVRLFSDASEQTRSLPAATQRHPDPPAADDRSSNAPSG
ncbi:hypothetical protein ACLOJK_041401 [Asimina triloba]